MLFLEMRDDESDNWVPGWQPDNFVRHDMPP
jgi:hypothetical protein